MYEQTERRPEHFLRDSAILRNEKKINDINDIKILKTQRKNMKEKMFGALSRLTVCRV